MHHHPDLPVFAERHHALDGAMQPGVGQALDDAVLDLHATQDGMTLSGRGLVLQEEP